MTTAFLTHADCIQHEMTYGHPESPQRLWAINDALIQARVMDLLKPYQAPKASVEQLLRVHTRGHVDFIQQSSPEEGWFAIDPDTYMNPHTLDAALRAAGSVVKACELVMEGEVTNAFCAVRPPGHHAERDRAMGFCFFNNVAVGVAHALEKYGLKRVAVVDFDVHHGNGTEDIFANESRVMLCSSFQHPFYPHSGGPSVEGHLVNVPLPAGTAGGAFRSAIVDQWLPQLYDFAPEMIFISAGFDAHKKDVLAQLNLVEDDYAWITGEIMKVARACSGNRIVSSLEGGYHLEALGASVVAHVKRLLKI